MELARTLADDGRFPEMSWAAAAIQTRGRGQSGRKWDSARGNLFATIRLPRRAAGAGTILPLALGRIIADELKNHMPAPQIKWPNDILMGGKKAGGILVEERQCIIMAGIGLNVEAVPETENHPGGYRLPACSLKEFGCRADAIELWRSLVSAFEQNLMPILASPDDLKHRLEQALAFKDEGVILENGNGESRLVRILGLDNAGRLIVETPRGKEAIHSGRIIPRVMI
jgi:BirA family biotin operon repressor/biotin-[acetyl-CoA-carboxylase] ligase